MAKKIGRAEITKTYRVRGNEGDADEILTSLSFMTDEDGNVLDKFCKDCHDIAELTKSRLQRIAMIELLRSTLSQLLNKRTKSTRAKARDILNRAKNWQNNESTKT